MDPIYPDNPTPAPGGFVTPPQKKRLTRKTWLIIIGALLAIVILASVIIGFGKKQGDSAVYYDHRDGFSKADLTAAIGDPEPLSIRETPTPITYQGEEIVQACNLFTVADVKKAGLHTSPNPAPALERSYFDGQSNGDLRVFPTSLTDGEDSNRCRIPLYKPDHSSVNIVVLQPSYNLSSALNYELAHDYTASGSVEGLQQYIQEEDDGYVVYILRDGDSALKLELRGINDEQLAVKIVAAIAAAYKREKASPAGPLQLVYDTPVFKKSYANSCQIVTAEDVQHVFSAAANPLVREQIATATGVTEFRPNDPSSQVSTIQHTCARQAVSISAGTKKTLTTESISYMTSNAAKLKMAAYRQLHAKVSELPSRIGDDAFFSYSTGENPELTVRKGRFVLSFSVNDQTRPDLSDQEMIDILRPVAEAAVSRIKDF